MRWSNSWISWGSSIRGLFLCGLDKMERRSDKTSHCLRHGMATRIAETFVSLQTNTSKDNWCQPCRAVVWKENPNQIAIV